MRKLFTDDAKVKCPDCGAELQVINKVDCGGHYLVGYVCISKEHPPEFVNEFHTQEDKEGL